MLWRVLRQPLLRRRLATLATPSAASEYQVGQTLSNFRIDKVESVPEFDMTAIRLSHLKTGAEWLHIAKPDTNNVFSVAFATPPEDSTGVPHILEHTVLCGSDRFPVRDPFFKMLTRSMSTYMNALTASDFTMYPFSTLNERDYRNLMSVYMDATFAPRLRELDFLQEGWRLDFENAKDSKSPLVFKGVVYNEMKGALSDVGSLFWTRFHQHLYPNTTYGHVSGGDPENITDLTHKQLVEFHRQHYHPSNSKFFTYGTFPLIKTLESVDAMISKFDKAVVDASELTNTDYPFHQPRTVRVTCARDPSSWPDCGALVGDPKKQTKMCLAFLTNDGTDVFESFALRLLTSLLIDGAASPMYRALIETNLGSDYAPTTGYDRTARVTNVSFGLNGIASEDVTKVENAIMNVLQKAAEEGFEPKRVEGFLHQMELSLKHRTASFGMNLGQSIMGHWMHGGDPIEGIKVTENMQRLRDALASDPEFFKSRIHQYFLNNNRRLLFVMEPEEAYGETLEKNESERLQEKVALLSNADKEHIQESSSTLLKLQDTKEDLSVLPTLTIQDVAKRGQSFSVEQKTLRSGLPLHLRKTATNGLSYLRIAKSLDTVPAELQPYVPLFCSALTSLGTSQSSLPELDEKTRTYTGGLGGSANVHTRITDLASASSWMTVSSNALPRNLSSMYGLLEEVLKETKWTDAARIKTMVLGAQQGWMDSLMHSGHAFAMNHASKGVSAKGKTAELWGGVSQVSLVDILAASPDQGVNKLSTVFQRLAQHVMGSPGSVKAALVTTDEHAPANQQHLEALISSLGWADTASKSQSKVNGFSEPQGTTKTFVPLPAAVNFSAMVWKSVPFVHPDAIKLQVLASLLTTQFLHREIREKGGAYGGGARYGALDGTLAMYSYRDPPGTERTLSAYQRAVEWAGSIATHLSQRELDEAKLTIFSSMDAPVSASQEGMGLWEHGITDAMRQARRDALFAVTLDDVQQVAVQYLQGRNPVGVTVLGDAGQVSLLSSEWTVQSLSSSS